MDKIINSICALATSAGPWLNRKWAWVAPLCALLLGGLLIMLGLVPSIPESHDKITIQWWKLGTLVTLPLGAFVIWFTSTQLYLRTGHGTKVGLGYDGPKVDLKDWRRTRIILKDLFAGRQIRNRVSLRFVPLRAAQMESCGEQYMKHYGFTILLVLEGGDSKEKPFDKISLRISTKKEAQPYLSASIRNALAIVAGRSQGQSLHIRDMHTMQAHMLRDLLLSFVATHYFVKGEYEDASTILQTIDHGLSDLPLDKPPRVKIRQFDASCCLRPLQFKISDIPSRDVLEQRIAIAERAMRYFDENLAVYTDLSRARFLLGDVQGAVDLTERANAVVAGLQKRQIPVAERALVNVHLNSAFLSFIRGHWDNACKSYMSMLSLQMCKVEDWNALVSFADYVRDLECYEGIVFLQVMYRRIASQNVPDPLFHEADIWLNEDGSRKKLRDLLHKAHEVSKRNARSGDKRTKKGKKGR